MYLLNVRLQSYVKAVKVSYISFIDLFGKLCIGNFDFVINVEIYV